MNISKFNNVLYKGNVNNDFYFYCLKKNKKLIKYIFINVFLMFISLFFAKRNLYKRNKFKYLKEVKNLNKEINLFLKNNKKINLDILNNVDVVIDKVPVLFMNDLFKKKKIYGYELNKDFEVDIVSYNEKISDINNCNILYLDRKYSFSSIKCDKIVVVHIGGKRNKISDIFLNIILCLILSILITCISFLFNNKVLDMEFVFSYFSPFLFLLNFIPIFLLMLLLLFISKRTYISWLLLFYVVIMLGIANQTVLTYRDDVVKFGDLALVKEAAIMTNRYDLVIKKYTIIAILLGIIIFFILRKFVSKLKINNIKRFIFIVIIIFTSFILYFKVYQSEKLYDKVGDKSLINVWISTRQSQIRGLIYPFIYSIKDSVIVQPKKYNEKKAKAILKKYQYSDISDGNKVNIIGIMLEAFNDFSKFEEINLNQDIYKNFHDIQAKSISGSLVTTIFGGGTVVTERDFLTGYYDMPNFRKKTNSYVWYFREQGYRVEAMHPIYGAFYNRASIDLNLGFDYYYNYENTFSKIQKEFVMDTDFFKYIEKNYEKSKKKNVPYFNFSVTYQNHGPYSGDSYDGKEYYFDNDGRYDDATYNTINEYLKGIHSTNEALKELIDYFDNEDSPVIVLLFGDHNPYIGDNGFSQIGVNMDLGTIDGFLNYYETPYIIHANDSAKKMFNKSFVGKGNTISPIFLMNELFDYIGLNGNEYMQYMSNLKKKTDVISECYYKEDGNFVQVKDSKLKKIIQEYEFVNYYEANNYNSKYNGGKK